MKNFCFFVLAVVFCSGCAVIKEDAKLIWGSSTKQLEDGRKTAVSKTFSCDPKSCFDAILKFADIQGDAVEPLAAKSLSVPVEQVATQHLVKSKTLEVFSKDRRRNFIVVMGIPDHVNTTEAGIFFTAVDGGTLVEVTSMSTGAKLKVSEMIFAELLKNYKEISL